MENRIPVYQDDPDTYMENICSDKVSQNGSENSSVLSGIVSPLIKWYRENKRILPWRDQNNAYYTGYRRSCSSRPEWRRLSRIL